MRFQFTMARLLAMGVLCSLPMVSPLPGAEPPSLNNDATSYDLTPQDITVEGNGSGPALSEDKLREVQERNRQAFERHKARSQATIAVILPEEYEAYQQALASQDEVAIAQTIVQVVAKMRTAAIRAQPSKTAIKLRKWTGRPMQTNVVGCCYDRSWQLCWEHFKRFQNSTAQQVILAEWDRCLGYEDDVATRQLMALFMEPDHRMFTDKYWQILEHSRSEKTVSWHGYLLAKGGDSSDLRRLRSLAEHTQDPWREKTLGGFASDLEWRLQKPDPSTLAPQQKQLPYASKGTYFLPVKADWQVWNP